jgi:type II secretory pathway predicted ATPase ExeA
MTKARDYSLKAPYPRNKLMTPQPLALAHWGLQRWPFCGVPDAARFYPTEATNEALARIEHLVEGGRRLGALLGEPGTGKTLVLQAVARRLARQSCAVVMVDTQGLSTREMLWQVASGLGAVPSEGADVAQLWRQIADRVVENRLQQIATVLLVDNAGLAGPDAITQLMRIARLDAIPSARWTIVLAAAPAQASRWPQTLRDLVDLRIDLRQWELEDTVGYVQTALVESGRMEPLFDDSALAMLHERAEGVPRRVARLADYALLAGAAAGLSLIDRAVVEGADQDLAWPTAAAVY